MSNIFLVVGNGTQIVDPDMPETWPAGVRQWATERAAARRERTHFTCDLGSDLIVNEAEFRELFGGRKVLAYHCTRLLDAEIEMIRASGLRLLSPELVEERIGCAHAAGDLSEAERQRLERHHVFARNDAEHRDGQICLVMGRAAFAEEPSGCDLLLSLWGGEAIYWDLADEADAPRLGRPTIVVVRVDVRMSADELMVFPGLAHLFVGRLLRIERLTADAIVKSPILPEDVLDLWQPGDAEYDRHPGLPRA